MLVRQPASATLLLWAGFCLTRLPRMPFRIAENEYMRGASRHAALESSCTLWPPAQRPAFLIMCAHRAEYAAVRPNVVHTALGCTYTAEEPVSHGSSSWGSRYI